MLVTGVRFRFNKFPPSNIVVRCFHTLRSHRIFSIGEDNPHVGKALDRWWERLWPVLAFSHLTDKKKKGQMIFHKPFLYSTNIPFPPFTAWVIASHECSRTPGSREMMPAPFFSQILLHATTTTLKLKSLQKILWIHDPRAVFLKSYHHPVDLEQCCVPFKSITTKSIYSQPSLSAPPLGI